MSDTVKYKKPNGTIIEINKRPETLAHAKEMGWVPVGRKKKAAK